MNFFEVVFLPKYVLKLYRLSRTNSSWFQTYQMDGIAPELCQHHVASCKQREMASWRALTLRSQRNDRCRTNYESCASPISLQTAINKNGHRRTRSGCHSSLPGQSLGALFP